MFYLYVLLFFSILFADIFGMQKKQSPALQNQLENLTSQLTNLSDSLSSTAPINQPPTTPTFYTQAVPKEIQFMIADFALDQVKDVSKAVDYLLSMQLDTNRAGEMLKKKFDHEKIQEAYGIQLLNKQKRKILLASGANPQEYLEYLLKNSNKLEPKVKLQNIKTVNQILKDGADINYTIESETTWKAPTLYTRSEITTIGPQSLLTFAVNTTNADLLKLLLEKRVKLTLQQINSYPYKVKEIINNEVKEHIDKIHKSIKSFIDEFFNEKNIQAKKQKLDTILAAYGDYWPQLDQNLQVWILGLLENMSRVAHENKQYEISREAAQKGLNLINKDQYATSPGLTSNLKTYKQEAEIELKKITTKPQLTLEEVD